MGAWLRAIEASRRPLVWLDDTSYTAQLLAHGRAPWLDLDECVRWRRSASRLLAPDVEVFDAHECVQAWMRRNPRPGGQGKLSTALADTALQKHLRDILIALRSISRKPLGITFASPLRWLKSLAAEERSEEPTEDDVDDLAGGMSRLLRMLSAAGLDVLLMNEESMPVVSVSKWADCYGSVTNVARHYGWDVGLHAPGGAPALLPGFDFTIGPAPAPGVRLERGFWEGRDDPPQTGTGQFFYSSLLADMDPTTVLERLLRLR